MIKSQYDSLIIILILNWIKYSNQNHQSRKGSSLGLRAILRVSDSGYELKLDVSFAALNV